MSDDYFIVTARTCNYKCGFCFHTDTSSFILPTEEAKQGLKKLKEAGMEKINFAGGEPFLKAEMLGELVMYCKKVCWNLHSVR